MREAFKLAEKGRHHLFGGRIPFCRDIPRRRGPAPLRRRSPARWALSACSTARPKASTSCAPARWSRIASQEKGVPCRPEEVLLTNGSQQALDLIAKVVVDPGDGVIVEKAGIHRGGKPLGVRQLRGVVRRHPPR